MGLKGSAWLELLAALSARYHALQPKGHPGPGGSAPDGGRFGKKRSARYAVSSRGLTDLRLLAAWLARAVPSHRVLALGLALAALLACALWLLAPARGPSQPALGSPPFRDTLVFSAAIGGSVHHRAERRLERPKFIPRVVHQTARSLDSLSPEVQAIRQTWARLNPGWEVRFWDDAACKEFVRTEFPEYLAAYLGLPKNVERADFFRYLVVLRHGGVYADIDTECVQPLDDVIRGADTLVAGWEGEMGDAATLVDRHFARYRQVQQWWFAGAPEHPALRRVCDHVAEHYQHRFLPHENADTLERTGPGPWTDAIVSTAAEYDMPVRTRSVLAPALLQPRSMMVGRTADAEPGSLGVLLNKTAARQRAERSSGGVQGGGWSVRILPIIATAINPGLNRVQPGALAGLPGVSVAHHFAGTWKTKTGYKSRNLWRRVSDYWARPAAADAALTPVHPFSDTPELEHYPVSVNLTGTDFTVMVNLINHGDLQSREDPNAALTATGNWQAGMDNAAMPRAPVALIGALGKAAAAGGDAPAFLDVGAGLGLYSLAAAARGYRVLASELADRSAALLEHSVRANGFERLVTVHNVTVGAEAGVACVRPHGTDGWRREDVQRGFAAAALHDQSPAAGCERHVRRVPLGALVPDGVRVGAVRVSAGAWTARALRGGLPFFARHRPAAILVELDMAESARGGDDDMLAVLRELLELGYRDMGHAGAVCGERFRAMVAALSEEAVRDRLQTDVNDLRQPVWCELDAGALPDVLERNLRNGAVKQDPQRAAGVEPLLLQLNTTVAMAAL